MAWIVKNSATIEIERREAPYLDDEMKQHLEAVYVPRFPTRQAVTLPALHAVQHKYGWIPYQAIEEVAAFLDLSAAEVLDAATFYEEFHLHPKGKYLIQVCQSISCELMGHEGVLGRIREKLGIDIGQTTSDGRFTLESVECLGSCGTAPCALVEGVLHENMTVDDVDKVLDALE